MRGRAAVEVRRGQWAGAAAAGVGGGAPCTMRSWMTTATQKMTSSMSGRVIVEFMKIDDVELNRCAACGGAGPSMSIGSAPPLLAGASCAIALAAGKTEPPPAPAMWSSFAACSRRLRCPTIVTPACFSRSSERSGSSATCKMPALAKDGAYLARLICVSQSSTESTVVGKITDIPRTTSRASQTPHAVSSKILKLPGGYSGGIWLPP